MSRSYQSAKRQQLGERLGFELDGQQFQAQDEISVLDFSELAAFADLDVSSPQGIAAIKEFFTIMLGPVEYARFRTHCRRHRTDDDTIVTIIGDLVEDFLGRPTRAPSPSPSSPSASGTGSTAPGSRKVVSLSRGTTQQLPPEDGEPPSAELADPPPHRPSPSDLAAFGDVAVSST